VPSFSVRMRRWFTAHPWLKLVSLVLAVLVWLYVRGEIMGVP
jgi:hypothetical protein